MTETSLTRFGAEYARHRAAEGRGHAGEALLSLPYLREGAFVRQWQVRARSFEGFRRHVLRPMARDAGRRLQLIDLGAGNGWLCYRVAMEGHVAVAVDIRDDDIDGLGAAGPFLRQFPRTIESIRASFDALPLASANSDIAIFNASLHYSTHLATTLGEAARVVRPGGRIVCLDSPSYGHERDGEAMVSEKKAQAGERFGERADALLALPFIEFLTRERLARASEGLGLRWRRRRIWYPLWYELRPLRAALGGKRPPSRFDLWIAERS